jgi:hypothetical protein
MPVTVYKSTDGSAPVLNGNAGSLCTVLDAILVNGYGAKSAAGWAIEFTGTNKRIYRPPSGALRGRYRIQDDAPRAAPFNDGREARMKGSEAASAIDTQTNLFPTVAQFTNGLFLRKSATADATARPWVCIADARTMYFYAYTGDYTGYAGFMMGEYYSLKSSSDAFNGMVIGRTIEQIAATPVPLATQEGIHVLSAVTALSLGHFVPRDSSEVSASAVNVGKHGNAAHSAITLVGLTQYPNPVDAGLYLSQVWLHEPGANAAIRGRLRGFWHFLHPVGSDVNDGDTWSGSGPLAGKTFMAIKPTPDGLGVIVMETSDTWETN